MRSVESQSTVRCAHHLSIALQMARDNVRDWLRDSHRFRWASDRLWSTISRRRRSAFAMVAAEAIYLSTNPTQSGWEENAFLTLARAQVVSTFNWSFFSRVSLPATVFSTNEWAIESDFSRSEMRNAIAKQFTFRRRQKEQKSKVFSRSRNYFVGKMFARQQLPRDSVERRIVSHG